MDAKIKRQIARAVRAASVERTKRNPHRFARPVRGPFVGRPAKDVTW